MAIQFKRTKPAWKGFGERGATARSAGAYDILINGVKVASVTGGSYAYMGGTSWQVFDLNGRNVMLLGSRREASEFVARRVEKYGSVTLPENAIYRTNKGAN